jgi:hypothetical protein
LYRCSCWFRFEPGIGKYANRFRIICPSSNTALVCGNYYEDPGLVRNISATGPYNDNPIDQYFSFVFEDMDFVGINYDLDRGTTSDVLPFVLSSQMLTNNTSAPQQISVEREETVMSSSCWRYESGFPLDAGTLLGGELL